MLDNYYCNGVNSSDGHSWSTEGIVTDHLEKSFGGFTRSYTFGDDPLTYSSAGFIWDRVLMAGLSFRNYGEFDYAEPIPSGLSFQAIYDDFISGEKKIKFSQKIGVARVSIGGLFSLMSYTQIRMACREIDNHGTYDWAKGIMPHPEMNHLY